MSAHGFTLTNDALRSGSARDSSRHFVPRRVRLRTRGFTLIEVLLAAVILAVCLISLGAVVAQGIGSAADSINQRAAREVCRAKLEEVVATGEVNGGGPVDGHDGFTWNVTREEHTAGAVDNPEEKYDVVTVTVTFPQDMVTSTTPGQTAGTSTVKLATCVDPPDLPKPGQPQQGAPAPGTGH